MHQGANCTFNIHRKYEVTQKHWKIMNWVLSNSNCRTSFIVPLQMDLILSELSSIFMSFLWTFTAVINPLCHKNCPCQPVKILSFQEGHIFDVTREFYTFHSFDLIEMENAFCGLDVSMLRYLVELRCSWTNRTLWIWRFRDSQD